MNTVVYYPHVRPPADWLKLASLCWDRVCCLVPDEEWDWPAEARELDRQLGGLIQDVGVARFRDDRRLAEQFLGWLDDRADQFAGIDATDPTSTFGMFPSKFSSPVLDRLQERGLAVLQPATETVMVPSWEVRKYQVSEAISIARPRTAPEAKYLRLLDQAAEADASGDSGRAETLEQKAERFRERQLQPVRVSGQCVAVHRAVGLHYMTLCAAQLAREERRDLGGRDSVYTDVIFSAQHLRGEVATAILESYLPPDLSAVSAERLAAFRSEHRASRLKYQEAIESMIRTFEATASEGALEDLKQAIIDIGRAHVEDTKTAYRRAKIKFSLNTVQVSLTPPAAIGFVASALGMGVVAPVGVAAALSLFGAKLLLDWRETRETAGAAPWSYVLDIQRLGRASPAA